MLKTGFFVTPTNSYTIYEIVEKGFHRIDFLKPEGGFQVDIDSVLYSQVRRKLTFTFGDYSIYDEYLRIMETIQSAKMKSTKESAWEDGEYVTTVESVNEKLGYSSKTRMTNGVIQSLELRCDGYAIYSYVSDPIYGIKLDPINFSEYKSLSLSEDTVNTSGNGLYYDVETLKRRHNIAHLEDYDFVVATDLVTARKRLREFKDSKFPLRGFDTETTGLDVTMYGEDYLVGVILGTDTNTATYFPFRHTGDFNLPISFLSELMEVVISLQGISIAHNKKFDRQVMLKEGFDLLIKWDTMDISIILNPILGKGVHGEKQLMYELDGRHYLELDEIFINKKDINFAILPVEIIKLYACPDGTNPIRLMLNFLEKIPDCQKVLAELESDLSDVKADQEYYGMRVDTKKFEQQYRNCNYIIDILLKAFRTLTHEDGNLNSSAVLSNLLYNKMHCKVLLRTKTGLASVSSAAIKKLANKQAPKRNNITEDLVDLNGKVIIKAETLATSAYPALVILAKYKEYMKLKTAFYSRFERTMKTGRIFFWINQNGAATGRQSSPMHQLPPELKDIILSDAEDRDFWGPDYSQVELRMIAYLAGEKDLIEMSSNPDNDIHRVIGSLITGKPMWAITPEERTIGKRRNFGVVYLISKFGLAGQLKGPGYTVEDVKFADQQLKDFFKRFKRIDRYIKRNAAKVQKQGYMETEWFHRKRLFYEIFDPNIEPAVKASILRMANNVPVQGTAADLMKLAEVKMFHYIREKGWNEIQEDGFPLVRLMLSIHDECLLSAHNSIPYEEIIEMITKCMEIPVDGAPPFFVQPARMKNWGEHSNDAVAMPIRFRDKVIKDYNRTGKSVFKQSWFELVMDSDTVSKLNSSDSPLSKKVNEFIDKVDLKFVRGDYTQEYTKEHVKDALISYISSGSTSYRIDNYITLLDEYRIEQLNSYMKDLISKYGTDYKVVGSNVRHPSLTFELLDVYKRKIPTDLSHEDQITEATRLYIEDLLSKKSKGSIEFVVELKDEKQPSDKDLFTQQLEPLVEFDNYGNVIFSEDNEAEDDLYSYFYDESPDDIIDECNNKPVYVWELADCITFDVQELSENSVNRVLSYIFKNRKVDGFYNVNIIYGDKLVDTKLRVEELNMDEANNLVLKLLESEGTYV